MSTYSDGCLCILGSHRENMPRGIAYSLKDYCELVDTTGRCIRNDKADQMDINTPNIKMLNRKSITQQNYHFVRSVGLSPAISCICTEINY